MSDVAVGITLKGDSSGLVTAVKTGEAAMHSLGNAANDSVKPIAQHAEESTSAFGKLREELGRVAIAYASFETAKELLGEIVTTIMADEKATASLNAVLKATGGQAGLTATQLARMADELEKSTLFDDTDIKKAEGVLLTFGGITRETFGEAIKLSADLAAVFGTDLQTASLTLGKALESPTDGLGALGRAGIKFTQTEKDMIQNLVETGHQADAAGVILDKVRGKIGGAAEAQHTGLVGAVHDLSTAWDDLLKAFKDTGAYDAAVAGIKLVADAIDTLKPLPPGITRPVPGGKSYSNFPGGVAPGTLEFLNADGGQCEGTPNPFDAPVPMLAPQSLLDAAGAAAWDKQKAAADAAAKAAADAAKSTADYIAQLQLEADNLARTSQEQDIYNALKGAGVTADSAAGKQVAALVTQIDTMKQSQKELNDELAVEAAERAQGKALIESLKTPFDHWIDSVTTANELLQEGVISQQQYAMATAKASDELNLQNKQMDKLGDAAQQAGDALSSAFVDAIANGKSLSDVLNALLGDILNILAKAGTSSLADLLGGGLKDLIGSLFGPSTSIPGNSSDLGQLIGLTNAQGNVFAGGNVVPFRKGGVVSSPAIFPMAHGAGLMGEAGPEAVMPLARGSDGSLGVRVAGGAGGVEVIINLNNYSGQPATATQRSGPDGQKIIDLTVGQAAAKDIGSRGPLAKAMETTYGLQRGGVSR